MFAEHSTIRVLLAEMTSSLPQPTPAFEGTQGYIVADSTPSPLNITKVPKGAPNIVLILLDDVGF